MTVVTLKPDGISTSDGGFTATGAGSLNAAVADGSDSSYIASSSAGFVRFTMDTTVLPTYAVVKSLALRARTAVASGPLATITVASLSPILNSGAQDVVWSIPTTVTYVTSPGALAQSVINSLEVALGSVGALRVYELTADLTIVTRPSVSLDNPAGTVTNTNRPVFQWHSTVDADGGTPTVFEARIKNAGGTVIETSGVLPCTTTAGSWQSTMVLDDGSYTAEVRVAQTVNGAYHWSDWDNNPFDVDVDRPAEPTLTVTPSAIDGWFELGITAESGAATTDLYELQRSTDAATWTPIRTKNADGHISAAETALVDWEAPIGAPVRYRVRALHNYSGSYVTSAWSYAWSPSFVVNGTFDTDGYITEWTSLTGASLIAGSGYGERFGGHFGPLFEALVPTTFTDLGAASAVSVSGRFIMLTGTSGEVRLVAALYDAAGVFVGGVVGATDTLTDADGWTTLTGTADITAMRAEYPEAVKIRLEVWIDFDESGTVGFDDISARLDRAATLDTDWWIRHPYDPDLGLAITLTSFPSVARAARQSTVTVADRPDPVFVIGRRGTLTGTVKLHLQDDADRAMLDALLDSGTPLLLHGPERDGWAGAYVVFGDLNRPRAVDKAFVGDTLDELPFTVAARPTGTIIDWPVGS